MTRSLQTILAVPPRIVAASLSQMSQMIAHAIKQKRNFRYKTKEKTEFPAMTKRPAALIQSLPRQSAGSS